MMNNRKERKMRYIAVSVLSFFVILPVFADARLPVVNLASAGVSARAAFGEPIVTTTPDVQKKSVVVSDAAPQKSEPQTQSVTRTATPRVATPGHDNAADLGGQIIASADVLSPRRPSSDLWAHSSNTSVAPLRLPSPDEFSVIRSDDVLPEESLNNPAPVRVADATQSVSQMSELDAQIALLNELQRRAEASVAPNIARNDAIVKNTNARSVAPRRVVARPNVSRAATAQKIARNDIVSAKDEDVKLSRMVVPMDDMNDDVVVRAVKRAESPRIAAVRDDMTKMTPSELRKAFRKTFLSENKHLSTFQIDDRFDVASDMTADAVGLKTPRCHAIIIIC